MDVLALRNALNEVNITPVVKDENESARLAGFGMTNLQMQQVFVHHDEVDQALEILNQVF